MRLAGLGKSKNSVTAFCAITADRFAYHRQAAGPVLTEQVVSAEEIHSLNPALPHESLCDPKQFHNRRHGSGRKSERRASRP